MSQILYIPRKLSCNDRVHTEQELLATSDYVVVLAEPGGGKTALMRSIAQQLGVSAVTANEFVYLGAKVEGRPLVIDAFDELAKIDQSGIHKLLAKAKNANPTHVIISSRSSEWDSSATNSFKEFLGRQPLVARLIEFDVTEQQMIFDDHTENEDFAAFQAEIARFDLEPLLPNPQFLKLFADAYIESKRHFSDKKSIFSLAVERLAKETNPKVARPSLIYSTTQKVDLSSEVFVKLLLSGAEGIGTSEATESRMYPFLASLFRDYRAADGILATRLFKPADTADQHRPVHKIVAEYCAADYLTKRIANPADSLTLAKCLPIIAPSSTVREELRGLLGWMASLGNKSIQESAIKLDPYAVLANGDPSQLVNSSKRLLVRQLKEVETNDPYFRRGDLWRKFSVAGFFTQDVVDEIKPILQTGGDSHLRDLLLELLRDSPAIEQLKAELRQLVLAPGETENARLLASDCLLGIVGYDHHIDLVALVSEESQTSLKVAANIIEYLGPKAFDKSFLAEFLRACANLYPSHKERFEHKIGARYFLNRFIRELELELIEWLLNELSKDLSCKCGKKSYECDCLNGISKIIGMLLDRFFEMATPPFDPVRIWCWIENLNFHEHKTAKQSKSIQVLMECDSLRQGIIAHAFKGLTDCDNIIETRINKFTQRTHSGLNFQYADYKFIVNLAFEVDNPNLWACFMARHIFYRNKADRGIDFLRQHMREQARKKPAFMREWAKYNRAVAQSNREIRKTEFRHNRWMKRRDRVHNDNRKANIKYLQDNRELVESGRDWGCLVEFSHAMLINPEKIKHEFNDENIVRSALQNCLDFIAANVPDLKELAELQCQSKSLHSEQILYAACLEIMRVKGNLESVDVRLLKALRTNINMGYTAVTSEERNALKAEVDCLIFSEINSAEEFLQQYVEPQLEQPECKNPDIWLLRGDNAFKHLSAKLSIDWLKRFRELSLESLDTLFDIAAQYGERTKLKEIIAEYCAEYLSILPIPSDNQIFEQKRKFWFLRAWYFLENPPQACWDWLKNDKETIFLFEKVSGQFGGSDYLGWPKLTARRVEAILGAFIDKWPKVHLPNHGGSGSPKAEIAYRYLTEVIWSINSDDSDDAIHVLDRLLSDLRFAELQNNLKSIRANKIRKNTLRNFEPPLPIEVVDMLDRDAVITVEGLRQLVIDELLDFQRTISGGEFDTVNLFYRENKRLDENEATKIIAERLSLRLAPQNIAITLEHHMKNAKRCDFTATKMIRGKRRLLVTEVKGQWNQELFTAAKTQLQERYTSNPDAELQGIYLILWFGPDEKIAEKKNTVIRSNLELKSKIESTLTIEERGLIDVFVLDVSRDK